MNDTPTTRERILDSAERMFARHGLDGASLRAITGDAGVNLASVNYHFGSKEALIEAVFDRRLAPVNAERLRLLSLAEQHPPPSLKGILDAFIRPAVSLCTGAGDEGRDFLSLAGRMHTLPPDYQKLFLDQFEEVFQRFGKALKEALPDLSDTTLLWRFFFVVGSLVMTLAGGDLMMHRSGGRIDTADVEQVTRHLTAFLMAGFKAPDPENSAEDTW